MIIYKMQDDGRATDVQGWPRDTPPDGFQAYSGQEADLRKVRDEMTTAAAKLIAARAKHIRNINEAGFAHVHGLFPPHKQRRLALGGTSAEKTACREIIEAVRARVDTAEAAIMAMTGTARMATEEDAALTYIVAL